MSLLKISSFILFSFYVPSYDWKYFSLVILNCPNDNLMICRKTEPIADGSNAMVYVQYVLYNKAFVPDIIQYSIQLHLFHPWNARSIFRKVWLFLGEYCTCSWSCVKLKLANIKLLINLYIFCIFQTFWLMLHTLREFDKTLGAEGHLNSCK